MIALLVSLIGVFIISIIVFGGGQVFMPLFKWLWIFINDFGANISDEKIDQIFTVVNSTPGVISTKFALFTGYLVANGAWWGWLALFLTYLTFVIPAIIAIFYATKMISKIETSKHLKNVIVFLKPVIAGIVIALGIQLFIGTAFPTIIFNDFNTYIGTQGSLFSGWRLIMLIVYSFIVALESAYLYYKKINIFILISTNLIIGLIIFQPWFM